MALKYFLYVSDAKLDMLAEQIPTPLRQRIAGDFSLDLKVVSMSIRSASKEAYEKTQFQKLQLVEKYIEKSFPVGTVRNSSAWFRGSMPLKSHMDTVKNFLFFSGTDGGVRIGLIGSSYHLQGSLQPEPGIGVGMSSYLTNLPSYPWERDKAYAPLEELKHKGTRPEVTLGKDELAIDTPTSTMLAAICRFADNSMMGPFQSCEFLARRLLVGDDPTVRDISTVIIATPLYIALSD